MSPQGIKDRIAIIGMSCTKFAEHFDKGLDDLLKEAALKACRSAHVELSDIEAYWFGTAQSAMSGIALARAIGVGDKPITRVEEFLRDRIRSAPQCLLRRDVVPFTVEVKRWPQRVQAAA